MSRFIKTSTKLFLLLILVGLLANFKAIAQEWAPIGEKWYFTPYMSSLNNICDVPYYTIEVIKDTLIQNKLD